MENHHEVVATVVGFVVALKESRPTKGREFLTARLALDSRLRGAFFVKLRLPDGSFDYEPGLHNELSVGDELQAHNCTRCGKKTWIRHGKSSGSKLLCLDCRELEWSKDSGDIDPQDEYDWSEHEQNCDGCSTCNPTAFRDED